LIKIKKLEALLSLSILLLLGIDFITPVSAGIPTVNNVVVWGSGGHTILNVTVTHIPASPLAHYVNRIEINVSGTNHIFNVVQNTTTFTYPCDLGVIEGTPSATVRAHCNVDGYGSWTEPIQVPEFPLHLMLLVLILLTSLVLLASRKIKPKLK